MARRIQSKTIDFRPKFVDLAPHASVDGTPSTQKGERSYTTTPVETPSEDIFQVLDGATVKSDIGAWHLSVWGIHQIGTEQWLQLSATASSAREDLVVHMGQGTRVRDALASVEAWLGYPAAGQSRIIHVV